MKIKRIFFTRLREKSAIIPLIIISQNNFHLDFFSGNGKIEINKEIDLKGNDETIKGCLAVITFV